LQLDGPIFTIRRNEKAGFLPPHIAVTCPGGAGRFTRGANPRSAAVRQNDIGARGRGRVGVYLFHFDDDVQREAATTDPVGFVAERDKDQVEVDLVLESAGRLAGVEVKSGSTVTSDDFKGLRKLREIAPTRFACGVILYDGEAVVPFGPGLYAVPLSILWNAT